MAIAYESVSATTWGNGLSVVIAKPSGLAVGDSMFAQVMGDNGASGFSTPSDWTALYSGFVNLGGNLFPCAVFYKVADSDDVAASNFTFDGISDEGGATEQTSGCILRISGFGIVDDSHNGTITGGSTSPQVVASTIDPVFTNGLAVAFLFGGDNASATISLSAPSIATNNPTWTSRSSDAKSTASTSAGRNVYTASRIEDTAWGDITITFSPDSAIGVQWVIAHLAPKINASYTVVTGTSYFVNHPFLRTGVIEIDGQNPDFIKMNKTDWVNEDKPSTSWSNETV